MSPLNNYIRYHRRKAHLTQKDLAGLLGLANGAPISRLEHFRCPPSLHTIIACELIFDKPAAELFPEFSRQLAEETRIHCNRLLRRRKRIRHIGHDTARRSQTIRDLRKRCNRLIAPNNPTK